MSFSYLIKVADEYVAIDPHNSNTVLWLLVKDKKHAMYMSKEYADALLTEVILTFKNAVIIGVEYDQN